MTTCKNCFGKVEDLRKETRCHGCNSPIHKDCAIKEGNYFCDVCYAVHTQEGNKMQIIIPDVIRRSYIETYKKCPYQFFLNVIRGLEMPPTIYTQEGIDLHDLFQIAQTDKSYTIDKLKKDFDNKWQGYKDSSIFDYTSELYDLNGDIRDKMYQRAIDSIDAFYDILEGLPEKPLALEETILFDVGSDLPKVSITMDRIDDYGDHLKIRDWKTGSVMVGKKLSTDLQAPLYIHAVKTKYGKHVEEFTLHYLAEGKERTFKHVSGDDYECIVNKRKYLINTTDAIREVQHIFSQIKKGNFNIPRDIRSMYFTCKTCPFLKDGTCKGAELESWSIAQKGVSW